MFNSLEDDIYAILHKLKIPGAIVSLKSNYYKSFTIVYGYSNLENKRKTHIEDKFRIGSITKIFTGIVLLQLYEEGLLDLDDPISKYLFGIKNGEHITIRDIGQMRSGIYNYTENDRLNHLINYHMNRKWVPSELYSVGIGGQPYFEPDEGFHYSNTNAVILGLLIEKITGQPIDVQIDKRIIQPLKLYNTKFQKDEILEQPRMDGYKFHGNKLVNVTKNNVSWGWAAAAISSTLKDMHIFAEYALGKHALLNNKSLYEQRNWKTESITKPYNLVQYYGFHLIKLGSFIGHDGSFMGYSDYLLCEEKTGTTLVITVNMQQTHENLDPAGILAQFIVTNLHL